MIRCHQCNGILAKRRMDLHAVIIELSSGKEIFYCDDCCKEIATKFIDMLT